MEFSQVAPGTAYTLRSSGEVSVSAKSVKFVGGIEGIARRLVNLWLSMPEHYHRIGESWYAEGHEFVCDVAQAYGYSVWQVAQVVAALSPQNPWDGMRNGKRFSDGNRLCAIKVVQSFYYGGASAVRELRGWGYAPSFVERCIKVLSGEDVFWDTSPKTYRFAMLLANPELTDIVVVDSHASRIATGNLGNRYHVVGKAAYPPLEKGYILAAEILGVPAYVLQAGTWQYAVDGELY